MCVCACGLAQRDGSVPAPEQPSAREVLHASAVPMKPSTSHPGLEHAFAPRPQFSRPKVTVHLDDAATKGAALDPKHFTRRHKAALSGNRRAFHKTKSPIGTFMQQAVGARALLPVQPAHRRLTCLEAELPKVLDGVTVDKVTPDTLRGKFGVCASTGTSDVYRWRSQGRHGTQQMVGAPPGTPYTGTGSRGKPNSARRSVTWGVPVSADSDDARVAQVLLQTRGLAKLSPHTSRRLSAGVIDEEPQWSGRPPAGARRMPSSELSPRAPAQPRPPVMGTRESMRKQALRKMGVATAGQRRQSLGANFYWGDLLRDPRKPRNPEASPYVSPSQWAAHTYTATEDRLFMTASRRKASPVSRVDDARRSPDSPRSDGHRAVGGRQRPPTMSPAEDLDAAADETVADELIGDVCGGCDDSSCVACARPLTPRGGGIEDDGLGAAVVMERVSMSPSLGRRPRHGSVPGTRHLYHTDFEAVEALRQLDHFESTHDEDLDRPALDQVLLVSPRQSIHEPYVKRLPQV